MAPQKAKLRKLRAAAAASGVVTVAGGAVAAEVAEEAAAKANCNPCVAVNTEKMTAGGVTAAAGGAGVAISTAKIAHLKRSISGTEHELRALKAARIAKNVKNIADANKVIAVKMVETTVITKKIEELKNSLPGNSTRPRRSLTSSRRARPKSRPGWTS